MSLKVIFVLYTCNKLNHPSFLFLSELKNFGSIPAGDSDFSLSHAHDKLSIPFFLNVSLFCKINTN